MPTYEYRCSACDHEFERFQSITADPIRKCPECGRNKVRRLIGTGAGVIFRGSGFYITDYRDKSYTEKAKAENGNGKAASDAKPATAAAAGDKPSSDAAKTPAKPAATPAASAVPAAPAGKPHGPAPRKKH
jgi:putative FmdB family regulatory protein